MFDIQLPRHSTTAAFRRLRNPSRSASGALGRHLCAVVIKAVCPNGIRNESSAETLRDGTYALTVVNADSVA